MDKNEIKEIIDTVIDGRLATDTYNRNYVGSIELIVSSCILGKMISDSIDENVDKIIEALNNNKG